ncbi:hypothetical protein SAMN05660429_02714, partial [Thalassotalea agarivorans]
IRNQKTDYGFCTIIWIGQLITFLIDQHCAIAGFFIQLSIELAFLNL